jgi:hypothetical protein
MNTNLFIHKNNQPIHFVSGLCGSGKSFSLANYIYDNYDYNSKCIVTVPSILLADQTYGLFNSLGIHNVSIINSNTNQKVIISIIDKIKEINLYEEGVLIITQQAFHNIPYFPKKEEWLLIIDEIPQVDQFKEFLLPHNHHLVSEKIHINQDNNIHNLYKMNLSVIPNRQLDDADKLFKPVIQELKDDYTVLTDKNNWDKIIQRQEITKDKSEDIIHGNDKNKLYFLSLMSPVIFLGFKQTIIMGANFETSLLYKLWSEYHDIKFIQFKPITDKLRYQEHNNGSRLKILYCQEARASKYSSKLIVDGITREQKRTKLVNKEFLDKNFIYMINNSSNEKDSLNGTIIPVISHGLNEYDSYHNVYFGPALNRCPKHLSMLGDYGIDTTYINRATSHEICYQGIMRTSMRNPDAIEAVTAIVIDLATAESLSRLFPGCFIGSIDGAVKKTISSFSQKHCNNNTKLKKLQDLIGLNSLIGTIKEISRKKVVEAISSIGNPTFFHEKIINVAFIKKY